MTKEPKDCCVEAARSERHRCADIVEDLAGDMQAVLLAAGEMTAQERRTVRAVLKWAAFKVRGSGPSIKNSG